MVIRTDFLTGAALKWAIKKAEALGNVDRDLIVVHRGNDVIFPQGNADGEYTGQLWLASYNGGRCIHGRTSGAAATLCYVVAELGETVDVPVELLNQQEG